MKRIYLTLGIITVLGVSSCQQASQSVASANDTNTPLHLLTPDYSIPYKEWNITEIKQCLDRIFSYLDQTTPPRVIDRKSGKENNRLYTNQPIFTTGKRKLSTG